MYIDIIKHSTDFKSREVSMDEATKTSTVPMPNLGKVKIPLRENILQPNS